MDALRRPEFVRREGNAAPVNGEEMVEVRKKEVGERRTEMRSWRAGYNQMQIGPPQKDVWGKSRTMSCMLVNVIDEEISVLFLYSPLNKSGNQRPRSDWHGSARSQKTAEPVFTGLEQCSS
jgi:hypothetical protein